MAEKQMQAVLKLRRDSENNFNRSNIVLQEGEIALVSTPFQGTQIKIGNGQARFSELKYDTLGLLARGFLANETTFNDNTNHAIDHDEHILFLDLNNGFLYYWDSVNNKYQYVKQNEVPAATSSVAGIMKLYDTVSGTNSDGAVTQSALNTAMRRIQVASQSVQFEMDSVDEELLKTDFSTLQALQILD